MPDDDLQNSVLRCYRCGDSLEALSLPLSRLDLCPGCGIELHVCRMCRHYAPTKPDQCDEDDAIEVTNKTTANFCDYFVPAATAFGGEELSAENEARRRLAALFGEAGVGDPGVRDPAVGGGEPGTGEAAGPADSDTAKALAAAEKLFRK